MKPMVTAHHPHRVLGVIAAGVITGAVLLVLISFGWTLWMFVMGLIGEHWPEWLQLCGVR